MLEVWKCKLRDQILGSNEIITYVIKIKQVSLKVPSQTLILKNNSDFPSSLGVLLFV